MTIERMNRFSIIRFVRNRLAAVATDESFDFVAWDEFSHWKMRIAGWALLAIDLNSRALEDAFKDCLLNLLDCLISLGFQALWHPAEQLENTSVLYTHAVASASERSSQQFRRSRPYDGLFSDLVKAFASFSLYHLADVATSKRPERLFYEDNLAFALAIKQADEPRRKNIARDPHSANTILV